MDSAERCSHRVEEQVGIEAVEFDQDAGGHGEPDGGEDRSSGEELLHRW